MNRPLFYIRACFVLILFLLSFHQFSREEPSLVENLKTGGMFAASLGAIIWLISLHLKKIPLLILNTVLFGSIMGSCLFYLLNTFTHFFLPSFIQEPTAINHLMQAFSLLSIVYFCIEVIFHSAKKWQISIPFVKFEEKESSSHKNEKMIITPSILLNKKFLNFMEHGIFNHRLILPKFLLKKACIESQSIHEKNKSNAKYILEIIKKLEFNSELSLEWDDSSFPHAKSLQEKFVQCAKLHQACILISEEKNAEEAWEKRGVRVINFFSLFETLKPSIHPGEELKIKIQRLGKEEDQGIGYLEDGSMIVVNGGKAFMGKTVQTRVISLKQNSARTGRIIFCNIDEKHFSKIENVK